MKTLLALGFIGLLLYLFATNTSSQSLARVYCRNKAQNEIPRVLEGAVPVRDRYAEQDFVEDCLEESADASLADILVKYVGLGPKTEEKNQ